MYPAWHQLTIQEYGQAFLWNSLAVMLCLITRTLLKEQLVIENIEDHLDKETKRRDQRRRRSPGTS